MSSRSQLRDRWRGLLLGTAVGDALGLPAEALSRRRVARLTGGRWRHRFLFGRGMVSDDTEHTLFVAQSLLAHPAAVDLFRRRLAWCLRGWLLGLPAGVGFATLRSILKLWLGIPPHHSGVRSAGNGAAMRAAPIGAFFASSAGERGEFVRAATLLTHRDPRARIGAEAVAEVAAWIVRENGRRPDVGAVWGRLRRLGEEDGEWQGLLDALEQAARESLSVAETATRLGLGAGVSGYVYHTVPLAIYAWYRHFGDFEASLVAMLDCGGDTDTTGAIVGALAGITAGEGGIPAGWVNGIAEYPRSPRLLRRVADRLADAAARVQPTQPIRPVRYFWPAVAGRNLLFLAVVLLHGLRRLAPPY